MVAGDSPRHPRYPPVANRARYPLRVLLRTRGILEQRISGRAQRSQGEGRQRRARQPGARLCRCNLSKAAALAAPLGKSQQDIQLFNPRLYDWGDCFAFVLVPNDERVLIEGQNDTGRVTVARLRMNAAHAARARWKWFPAYALESEYLAD